jgi:uncharacterized protein (TIGR00369 family)
MTGLEVLRSLPPDDGAPIASCLDFRLVEIESGRVVFELLPAEFHYNPMGTMHGGVPACLCDAAAGAAVHSMLPAGVGYTTLELKTNFLRPITTKTGLLRCEGRVDHMGSRTALATATLVDASGKLHAKATSTCLVLGSEPKGP